MRGSIAEVGDAVRVAHALFGTGQGTLIHAALQPVSVDSQEKFSWGETSQESLQRPHASLLISWQHGQPRLLDRWSHAQKTISSTDSTVRVVGQRLAATDGMKYLGLSDKGKICQQGCWQLEKVLGRRKRPLLRIFAM